jgi:hypothetical protein
MITAIISWALLTFGMTYLVTRAEILHPVRIRLVAWRPFLALLLSCRACTAFWTAQAATAATMAIACGLGEKLPWHAWLYLPPASGIAAIGLIDLIAYARHGGNSDA